MKTLSPKDASILALVAENSGMTPERMLQLVEIADDVDEVKAVARLLLNGGATNGTPPSQQAQDSARDLRKWVLENRDLTRR